MADNGRDYRLWVAGAFMSLGVTLVGVAVSQDGRPHFVFWLSVPMICAYAAFSLALACLACAVAGIRFAGASRRATRAANAKLRGCIGLADSLVIIEGPSAAGKTRMAYEAIHRHAARRRLVIPANTRTSLPDLRDLAASGILAARPRCGR